MVGDKITNVPPPSLDLSLNTHVDHAIDSVQPLLLRHAANADQIAESFSDPVLTIPVITDFILDHWSELSGGLITPTQLGKLEAHY
jgi:hypothetical protein